MTPLIRFRHIAAVATRAFGPASGAPEIIPHGAALVELVRSNPQEREAFEKEFIACIGTAPPELIEFCMHALRWKSLQDYFMEKQREAVVRNDWRTEPYYRGVLEAFDEEWADAKDFYASYFKAGA